MTASPRPPDPLAAAAADLDAVAAAPLEDQAAIFDRIHQALVAALSSTDPPSTADGQPR